MKYAVKMDPDAMIYEPNFIKIASAIRKVMEGDMQTDRQTDRQTDSMEMA
jgi:hypothetical protein